jgi:predicted DNA-binding transcriptional regulator YafY
MKTHYGNPHMNNTLSSASNPGFQTSPKGNFDLAKNFKLPPLNFKPALTEEQLAAMNIVNQEELSRQST